MEIPIQKKNKIEDFTSFISESCSEGFVTNLETLTSIEGIPVHFDHYENHFDGILLFDSQRFHIHLNIDRGNHRKTPRGRFTLAHELGHFFIDEHRKGLMSGKFTPHPSFISLANDNLVEMEADYFASCLLMPKAKIRETSSGKNFSFESIYYISELFQTSILATLIRFAEVGTHEIFVVVSKNNTVKWFLKSKDFPPYPFRFKVGGKLPPTTVAGEYFIKKDSKFTDIEQVFVDDWFYGNNGSRSMNEQCLYMDTYGYVVSLIWFD